MLDSGEKSKERNKRFKVKAIQVENQWNRVIKDGLNRESIFRVVGLESELKADKLRMIREQVEVLSLKYNFPTKNDVANIAKLLIQIEDKIDRLEEHMHEANFQTDQSEVQSPYPKKNMVKVIVEDMMQRQAIVSKVPGIDAKVVRPDTGEHDG